MKTILAHFDRLMAAITFAEANEPELAKEFLCEHKPCAAESEQASKLSNSNGLKRQTGR